MKNISKKHAWLYAVLCLLLSWMGIEIGVAQTTPTGNWIDYADVNWAADYDNSNPGQTAYVVEDEGDLAQLAVKVNSGLTFEEKTITLNNDLDLSAHEWTPIGREKYPFKGIFNGQGHKITGLIIINGGHNQGLFGVIENATIQGLVVGGSVNALEKVGGIVGCANEGLITECRNEGNVTAKENLVGGIVGKATSTTITKCSNMGEVRGVGALGGICGEFLYGSEPIEDCHNTGTLTCDKYKSANRGGVGGIVGATNTATINNCHNEGDTSGFNCHGGIVGICSGDLTISNCYNSGTVESENNYAGGILAFTLGSNTKIINCYNSGNVKQNKKPSSWVGGICGFMTDNASIEIDGCFNTGNVSGEYYPSGLIGCAANITTTTIKNSFFLIGTCEKAIGEFNPTDDESLNKINKANPGVLSSVLCERLKDTFTQAPWTQEAQISDNGGKRTLTMPQLNGITAPTVAVPLYELTLAVSPTEAGSITKPTAGTQLEQGETVDLAATEKLTEKYTFAGWTVKQGADGSGADVPVTLPENLTGASFVMPGNKVKITANFKPIEQAGSYELADNLVYNGAEQKGISKVLVDGKEAGENEYTITYRNNVNAGTAKATLKFTDPSVVPNEQAIEFTINPATLTVTPDANQVVYAGGDDYVFTYKSAGAVSGETPAFSGNLAGENGTIKQGSLKLKDNGKFLANNYELVVKPMTYTQESETIEQALQEAKEATKVDETTTGMPNENGWYTGSNGLNVEIPAGFEASLDGQNWYENSLNIKKEGEYTQKVLIRRVGGKQTESKTIEVKLDITAPSIELDHLHSLSAFFRITDSASGVKENTFDEEVPSVGLRSAKNALETRAADASLVEWRGKDGVNKVTITATDHAGNVTSQTFTFDLAYIGWNVILPESELAYIVPDPGTYNVEDGDSFVFRLKPHKGYALDQIQVSVENGEILLGEKGRYTIDHVTSDMNILITLGSPTGNEEIEITEFGVRTANGAIVIASPTRTNVQIIDLSGRVLRGLEIPAGTTYCTGLSKGVYIVRSSLGTVKIAL